MDPRTYALLDQAHRRVNRSTAYIAVKRVLFNYSCTITVRIQPTTENLRLIQQQLDNALTIEVPFESNITDCERLASVIYVSLALEFPDSQVNVKITMNDHVDTTFIFN